MFSSGEAGLVVFRRVYEGGRAWIGQTEVAGVARPSDDPEVRAAPLMVNDFAVLPWRDQLRAVLGIDPLRAEAMTRLLEGAFAVNRDGLFQTVEDM